MIVVGFQIATLKGVRTVQSGINDKYMIGLAQSGKVHSWVEDLTAKLEHDETKRYATCNRRNRHLQSSGFRLFLDKDVISEVMQDDLASSVPCHESHQIAFHYHHQAQSQHYCALIKPGSATRTRIKEISFSVLKAAD